MVIAVAILTLTTVAGLAVAVVAMLGRQQRAITRANRVIADRPTRAPRSWAGSHDPEALLHRRLRDAMTALYAVTSYDSGSALVLRADLEQTALDLDDHLVAVSQLRAAHKAELLQTITTAVECIESGVAQYAAAATTPATAMLDADITAVQRHLETAAEIQQTLRLDVRPAEDVHGIDHQHIDPQPQVAAPPVETHDQGPRQAVADDATRHGSASQTEPPAR